MKIIRGTDRIVLTLPSFGIVIKFANIKIILTLKYFFTYSEELRRWRLFRECDSYFYKCWIFNGIIANKIEWKLWRKTKHPILVPTYFSFFGLFNIQKYVKTSKPSTSADIWCQLNQLINPDWLRHDKHAFVEEANFTTENGKIQFLDYGSRTVIGVVLHFGDLIYDKFDTELIWDTQKKVLTKRPTA